MNIDKILNKNEVKIKNYENQINYSKSLIHQIGMNAYEKLGNFNITENERLSELLKRSNFNKISSQLSYFLSIAKNKEFGMAKVIKDNKEYILFGEVIEYSKWIDEYDAFTLQSTFNYKYTDEVGKEQTTFISFMFLKTNNGYSVEKVYKDKSNKMISIDEEPSYYKGELPVYKFENNELNLSDVDMLVDLLSAIDFFSEKLISDHWKNDVSFVINKTFGSEMNMKKLKKDIENSDGTEANDIDGKLAGAVNLLNSGTNLPMLYVNLIQFLEDKILKFSGSMREISTTATNKLNNEVISQNQKALEYLIKKIDYLGYQYSKFFSKIVEEDIIVEIELPMVEAMKVRSQEASIAMVEGQANNFNANAEKALKGIGEINE